MIDCFKLAVVCAITLILQCVLSPISATAADVGSAGAPEPIAVSSGSAGQEEPSAGKGAEADGGQKTLATLVGRPEIAVLADIGGQFVSSMAAYQVMEDEAASLVEEAGLAESIQAGRTYNRDSLAALARTEQAKAQTQQTLALLLPNVAIRANRGVEVSTPSAKVDDTTGELSSYSKHLRTDVSLTVTQPLFNLSSYLDWQRRKVKERASRETYRISDGEAYLATVDAYLSLVSTQLQADVARDFEAQLAELLDYIEKRAGAGAASVSDMARVRARREAILSSRLELESAHRAAGTEFVQLTNLVPEKIRLPVLEDVGISNLPKTFDEAVVTAMQSNPEIASVAAELEAERIDNSAAKARYLPRIDAEITDNYSLNAGGLGMPQRDKRYMLVLNWNLFSGWKDYNYIKERASRYKEIQYRLDNQRRRVVQALSANYAGLVSTSERLDSGYQELESISTAADAMSKRMLSGNQSLLDLLDVYNQRYLVRSRLVTLHVAEMNTVAQLIRLTHGTPWVSEGAE